MFHVKHIDNSYLNILYKLALKSYDNGDIPVGAIVIYNYEIIGKGYNNRQKNNNVCGHAEINAIKMAENKLGDWRLNDCILISTLKPCKMCAEVINTSRISEVFYLIDQNDVDYDYIFNKIEEKSEITDKIKELMNNFFKNLR